MARFLKTPPKLFQNLGGQGKESVFLIFALIIIFGGLFYYFNLLPASASNDLIKIFPDSFSVESNFYEVGWHNPESAFLQDLPEIAGFNEFNFQNSAYIDFPAVFTATPPAEGINSVLQFSDFSIAEETKERKIKNAQLRISLAGKGMANDKLDIDYYHQDSWQKLDEINLENEISNALNGGYFLYGLPIFENWQDLENLKIKFTYVINQKTLSKIKNPAINGTSDESQNDSIHSALTRSEEHTSELQSR